MARPKKTPAERFSKQLPPVRCTKGEYASIQVRASQANMTVTEFIRRMALAGEVIVQESRHDFQTVDQLRRIGININQQMVVLHSTREAPPELVRLWSKLETILDHILETA